MTDNETGITKDQPLSIIDLQQGKTQTGHTEEFVMELLGVLCAELPQDILLIKDAYAQNNIDQLQDLLHKLKGGLYYCGVPKFQKVTTTLHNQLKKVNQTANAQALFDQFLQESDNLLQAYQQLLKKK